MDPGTQVGRFVIEAEVGRGGMGVVYRAHDPRLRRLVALKVLAPGRTGDRARGRFEKEAAAAARLSHPHIATVYEFGEHDGQLYLALEWIDGQTLPRVGLERALEVLTQAADALDCAHRAGVVHRDVKPSNLMLSGDRLVLVDFGLAALVDQASATGSLVGTPHYLAPEIIRGEPVDGRADQYSLAAVLFECVTGRRPFEAPTVAALLSEHVHRTPPRADEFNPALPPALSEVLQRGLAKRPADRFATVTEFVRAARSPVRSRRARPRWPWAVAGLAVLAAVALTPTAPPPVTHLGLWEAPGGGPQRSNVSPRMGPLQRRWERPAAGSLAGVLTAGSHLLARWEDGRMECLDASTGRVVWTAQAPTTDWALSEDVVYTTAPAALDVKDGHPLWRHDEPLGGLVALDDGPVGLSATDGTLHSFAGKSGTETVVPAGDGPYDPGLCATEDGLFATSGPAVIGFDRLQRKRVWSWTAPAEIAQVLASLNGQGVVVGTHKGHLAALNPADGTPFWTVRCPGPFAGLACDGYSIAVLGREGLLEVREPEEGKVRWQVELGEPVVEPPTLDAENVRVLLPSGRVRLFSLSDGRGMGDQSLGPTLTGAGPAVVRVSGGRMELWCP